MGWSPTRALGELVRAGLRPGMVVCEVGCHDGTTTASYLPLLRECGGRLIAVDWFKGNEGTPATNHHGWRPEGAGQLEARFWQNTLNGFMEYGPDGVPLVTLLRGDSPEMAELVPFGSVDLCFIDADHRYGRVRADIEAWEPRVRPGGILCGHDCETLPPPRPFTPDELERDWADGMHCGVIQAVWERYGDRARLEQDPHGTGVPIWWVRL